MRKRFLVMAVLLLSQLSALIFGPPALANTGSSVAIFGPAGQQVGDTVTYPKAPTGSAWALFDDSWQWTATPTPGDANVLSEVRP